MKTSSAQVPDSSSILLVDDNNYGLSARKALLEELGYKIRIARSGEEAIELYTNEQFDLVVTDYKMPKMNGVELIQKIRKSDAKARIIMLSGFVEPLGLDEKTTGADVVISKSSGEVQNLLRAVSRLLDRRAPRKPSASQKAAQVKKAQA